MMKPVMNIVTICMRSLNKKEIDLIYDDRDERPEKNSQMDLIGIPFQIIVGNNFKSNNEVSIIDRLKK